MLHLSDVLQFVIDGFDNGSLSCQQSVRHAHDGSLHIALEFRYQLYAIDKKPLEEFLSDISLVPNELTVQEFYERLVSKRLAVIDVSWGNHEVKQLSFLIADEVQLEAKEPAHGAFAPLGDALECPMNVNTLIATHPEGRAVHETDAGTLAQQYLLDEEGKRYGNVFLQFYKAVVGHHLWKKVAQSLRDMLQIEVLQAAVAGIVEKDHDDHNLGLGKRTVTMVFPLFCLFYGIFCHHFIKKLAKIICHTENFSNFVLGKH